MNRTVRRSERPSLRHGLPYRWWASRGFREGATLFTTMLCFVALVVMGAALSVGYWTY